jgi:hypothetical protein
MGSDTMKQATTFKTLTLAIAAALALATGCKDDKHCDTLASKICEGNKDGNCVKTTKGWIQDQMSDDGKKASADEANLVCKMVLDDKDALEAWKAQAARGDAD